MREVVMLFTHTSAYVGGQAAEGLVQRRKLIHRNRNHLSSLLSTHLDDPAAEAFYLVNDVAAADGT